MKKILLLVTGTIFLFVSCTKDSDPTVSPPPTADNFDWKTTKCISISIPVEATVQTGIFSKVTNSVRPATVRVYTSPIFSESSLIASGAAYEGHNFTTVIDIAKQHEQVYVKTTYPNGLRTLATYDITGSRATKALSATTKAVANEPVIPKPDFPATYDVTINNVSDLPQEGTFIENKTYFIPKNVSINTGKNLFANWNRTNHPVLYVQGDLTLMNTTVTISYSTIVVLDGGTVTIEGSVYNSGEGAGIPMIYVAKGGKMSVNKECNFSGTGAVVVNEGEFEIKHTVQLSNVQLYNTGELEFEGNTSLSNKSVFYNTGECEFKDIHINSRSSFYNYKSAKVDADNLSIENTECYLYQGGVFEVDDTFKAKGTVDNYGRLECETLTDGSTLYFNSYKGSILKTEKLSSMNNATFNMESGSIIYIYKNGNGNGNTNNWNVKFVNDNKDGIDYALILWGVDEKKPDNTIINSKGEISFTGNIENHCPKKNDSQNGKYTDDLCSNNAYWGGRDHHIPESDFNEGMGSMDDNDDPADTDGDGVPDSEDADPNDPGVTHVSYFPNASTWGTYCFEDLWPYTGDYDMNDIVLGFQIAYYSKGELSANNNNIVYMDIKWALKAVGSQMQLAFGIQLDDITPDMVSGVTNDNANIGDAPINRELRGMESGQSKAVFALFNNPGELYNGTSKSINVFANTKTLAPVEKHIRIRFTSGVSKERLAIDKINPFIVASADDNIDRGHEIHLSTNVATDKVNSAFFTQGVVSEKNPYKATNGMVWGFMLPVEFRYPIEMHSITNAYADFEKWYSNSGTTNSDWYMTNVVEEHLYKAN